MNKQRFLYLIPPEKSFYKIRNERFIINALKNLSHDIIEINKFYWPMPIYLVKKINLLKKLKKKNYIYF